MTQTSAERREQWRKTLAESEGWAYSDLEPHDYQQQAAAGEALSDKESTEVLRVSDAATNTILKARDTEIERLRAELNEVTGVSGTLRRQEVNRLAAENARLRAERDEARGRVEQAEAELEKAHATAAEVRRLCELTIRASSRVHAVDQARDTLAILDQQANGQAEQPHPAETTWIGEVWQADQWDYLGSSTDRQYIEGRIASVLRRVPDARTRLLRKTATYTAEPGRQADTTTEGTTP